MLLLVVAWACEARSPSVGVDGVALCDPWACEGAWIDTDGDRERDEHEAATDVDPDGRFRLQDSADGALVAWARVDTVDVLFLSPPGETLVSPLTSLVEARRTLGSFSDAPASTLQARDSVCASLGVDCDVLLEDYRGSADVATIAEAVSRSALDNWTELVESSPPSAIAPLVWQWVSNHLPQLPTPLMVAIPPAPTGRDVVLDYDGVPEPIRRHLPKYTNAYVSEVEGFDYRNGVAILGARDVSDREMLRTRDVVNAVLLASGDARRGMVEYQSYIGVLAREPGGPDDDEGLLSALLSLRPLELIYTDPNGDGTDNEAGLDGEPEATTHHVFQVLAYYALNNAPYYADVKAELLAAYASARERGIYEPRDKYLEPDIAHPGILTAPGAYFALAADVYYGIAESESVDDAEYRVSDREHMADADPLMYAFLSRHFDRDWFDYDTFVRPEDGYVRELRRLNELGVLERP